MLMVFVFQIGELWWETSVIPVLSMMLRWHVSLILSMLSFLSQVCCLKLLHLTDGNLLQILLDIKQQMQLSNFCLCYRWVFSYKLYSKVVGTDMMQGDEWNFFPHLIDNDDNPSVTMWPSQTSLTASGYSVSYLQIQLHLH